MAKIVERNVKDSKINYLKKTKKLVSDNLIVKGKDKRNYKVNFDKFSKTFKFRADYKIDNGINSAGAAVTPILPNFFLEFLS